MINAGRRWIGKNYRHVINLHHVRRTVTTGSQFEQRSQAEFKEDSNSDTTGINPSNFEPPSPPGVSRTYLDECRRPMKPFMKELFCGRADTQVFSYPDVINNDAYYDIFKRCGNVQKVLKEKIDLIERIDSDGKVSKDLLLALRSQGFYALNTPESDGGEGLSMTESLRLIEELSVNLSLSENIITPLTLGYKAIQLYGTDIQKSKYLPKLISGQKIGTICISDDLCGSDPSSTNCRVTQDADDGSYSLNGTKTWVANGPSADVFTVFANLITRGNTKITEDTTLAPQPKLTAFLVERTMPGVQVHSTKVDNKIGLKGFETCPVQFNDVILTSDHVIGEEGNGAEVLLHTLSADRIVSAAKITASLRILLNETIKHASRRKQFQKRLIEFELIQHKLATSAHHLYALESAVYMTAGFADYQKEPDITVESAATKRYAVKTAQMIVKNCLSILGSATYLEGNRFNKIADDLTGSAWWEGTDEMLAFHIVVSGIGHVSTELKDAVTYQRNGLTFPFQVLSRMAQLRRVAKDKPKLTLEFGDYVHPSLSQIAEGVEYFVHRFHYCVEMLLVQEGQNAAFKEIDLVRLADVSTDIYMMICAMARANRSYCGGHEHADHEVSLVRTYINEREPVLKQKIDELLTDYWEKRDKLTTEVANYMADRGSYCPVHPVTKNWF